MTEDVELPEKYKDAENKEELKKRYKKMKFEPGEAIGILASQSISEPATQMTMETYHSAGAASVSVTLGLPRLVEIVNARKNPKNPIMDIYLKEDYQDEESAKEVAAQISKVMFSDLVHDDTLDLQDLKTEIKLNQSVMDEYKIDREDVLARLRNKLKQATVKDEDEKLILTPDKKNYDLKDLKSLLDKANQIKIKGIKGIEHVVVVEEHDEWKIQTAETNLRKVLKIEEVDATRTTSNDFYEVNKVLGIEAARNLIYKEIQDTLEEQGIHVDARWLLLIADTMTKDGEIKGTTRYGIVGDKNSVLARASFEETKKHVSGAAIKGTKDELNSIVENIILGQVIPAGTGSVKLKPKTPSTGTTSDSSTKEKETEETEEVEEEVGEKEEPEEETETTEFDYEEKIDDNIPEVKQFVKDNQDKLDLEHLIEAEGEGKNRKTLKSWLKERISEEGE